MKKTFFLTAFLSIMALTASAQVWVGGELYFRRNKATLGDLEINSNTSVGILPEIGYRFSDRWAVALRFEYSHADNGAINLTGQTLTGKANTFSIRPFARYTIYKADKFSFLLDGGLGYGTTKISGYNSLKTFDATISPALSYDLNHHWSLTAHLGRVGYEHLWTDFRNDKLKSNNFDFDVFGSLTFGLSYSF